MDSIMKYISNGNNIFVYGAAGTGKSYNIIQIKKTNPYFELCSSTGISALNIGGITFHNLFGVGIADKRPEEYLKYMKTEKKKFLRKLRGVIIDECSMLGADAFEIADKVLRSLRGINKPFGGVQILLFGDFFQLPPIRAKYLFESDTWYDLDLKMVELKEVKRQADKDFIMLLSKLRLGNVDQEAREELKKMIRTPSDDMLLLCPLKEEADRHNKKKLREINEEEMIYNATFGHEINSKNEPEEKHILNMYDFIRKNTTAREELILKKSCKVLYIKNDRENGLVNGSEGIVIGFNGKLPIVKFGNRNITISPLKFETKDTDDNIFYMSQIPLIVCYALSIHKSQGMTLSNAAINLGSNIFERHQAYVAISRIKSPDGVYIMQLDNSSFYTDPKVKTFYKNI